MTLQFIVGLPCLMPVTVEGVGHIWDRSAPFVTAALHIDPEETL